MTPADRFWHWVARHLPARLVYWSVIVAWARTTTGRWSKTPAPDLTTAEMLKRLEMEKGLALWDEVYDR
jgi:hypothetical protein